MSKLTVKDATLLKPYLGKFIDLAEGRRLAETDAQRLFRECALGRRAPVTPYEIAFVAWQDAGRPDLAEVIASQPAPDLPKKSASKKRRRPRAKSGMSVAEAKKPPKARWTPEEIAAHHRKSGFNAAPVIFQGGRVSPR